MNSIKFDLGDSHTCHVAYGRNLSPTLSQHLKEAMYAGELPCALVHGGAIVSTLQIAYAALSVVRGGRLRTGSANIELLLNLCNSGHVKTAIHTIGVHDDSTNLVLVFIDASDAQVDESLQAIIASAPGATSATSTPWVAATEIDAALQQDFDAAFIKKHFGISEAEISMYGTCTWKALQDAMLSRLATKDL